MKLSQAVNQLRYVKEHFPFPRELRRYIPTGYNRLEDPGSYRLMLEQEPNSNPPKYKIKVNGPNFGGSSWDKDAASLILQAVLLEDKDSKGRIYYRSLAIDIENMLNERLSDYPQAKSVTYFMVEEEDSITTTLYWQGDEKHCLEPRVSSIDGIKFGSYSSGNIYCPTDQIPLATGPGGSQYKW